MASWTTSYSCCHPQYFVALKNAKESSAAKMFFNRDADGRSRQENHRSHELFERAIAVGNAEAGDIVDGLVLEFDTSATIKNRVTKGNIFGSIKGLKDTVHEIYGQARS